MKLLCAEYNEAGEVAYNVIGDNALLRNNDDFYIPAFATELSCVPQIVLRVGKIGKHVAERFAGRYYEEVGVGIRFYADNLERELQGKGLSSSMAFSFDGAVAISEWQKMENELSEVEFRFMLNGLEVNRMKIRELLLSPEKIISKVSEFCMLKIVVHAVRRLHAAADHGHAHPAVHHVDEVLQHVQHVLAADPAVSLRRRRVQHLPHPPVRPLHPA